MNSCFLIHLLCAHWTVVTLTHALPEAEKPLILTPIIEANRMCEARNASAVKSLYDDVGSYSGYLTVDKSTDSHLFFWFFPGPGGFTARNVPLILWLGGGPGMTSLNGMFLGSGPIKAVLEENNITTRLEKAKYPWTNEYHMLYIDQPVGTGFSFTNGDGYVHSSKAAADHLYIALDQFFQAFGLYDLYIAGESYAGKFIPAIANRILEANEQKQRQLPVQVKGLMIGNGLTDPENMLDYDRVLYSAGLINASSRVRLQEKQNLTRQVILSGNWKRANELLLEILNEDIVDAAGLVNLFDYRFQGNEYFNFSYVPFLQQEKTRKMIHVGRVPFHRFNQQIFDDFDDDMVQTARPLVEKLVQRFPILFYNGLYDIACSPLLTETFLSRMNWSEDKKFEEAETQSWKMDFRVIGNYKRVGNLIFAKLRGAGHSVTWDQPEAARFMMSEFIKGNLQDTTKRWKPKFPYF